MQKYGKILETVEQKNRYRQASIEKMGKEFNTSSYQGNALQDLRQLRLDSELILEVIT